MRVLASLKANPTLATRAILSDEGLGCDTFGETELVAALRAGVRPELISVNGASKSERLIRLAVGAGARITLDSARELPLVEAAAAAAGVRSRVRIRLRPRLAGVDAQSELSHDGTSIRDAFQSYKAGVPIDDAVELGARRAGAGTSSSSGLHVHLARQTTDTALWAAQIESFVDLVGELSTAWDGWVPQEIDVGGGWPSSLDPVGSALGGRPATIAAARRRRVRRPGREHARSGARASRARASRDDPGGRAGSRHLRRRGPAPRDRDEREAAARSAAAPLGRDGHVRGVPVRHDARELRCSRSSRSNDRTLASAGRVDVTGISCNFDLIAPDVDLPEVGVGDILAFLETGAYQEASAANFNGLPRPATVLVSGSDSRRDQASRDGRRGARPRSRARAARPSRHRYGWLMQIAEARAYRQWQPFRDGRYACSGGVADGFDSTIVALEGEDGTTGYGEAAPLGAFYAPAFPAGVRAGVAELLPLVIGADATAPPALLRRLDTAMLGQPAAKSALDMAACDLAARLAGVALCEALGGRDGETVALYRSVISEAPDAMAERARGYVRDGYQRIQVKVGADPLADAERLHAVRDAVGACGRARVRRERELGHRRRAAVPAGDPRARLRARAAVRDARRVRARPRSLRAAARARRVGRRPRLAARRRARSRAAMR